ncbi:polysaccharide deacetylase family protein [Bradyrhizobium sp. KBS0727]|uniref:polysaccharide deacetylase family protein n=1 Tax=unclassified Bradyrhizobium TaxID=2631580 RepID=UPI00110E6A27|nr:MULTISPECIES: polysaccharide deacetylase family protein [unclassified Bradyrhizobium]QDW35944.1 polysaccharide deacetylase family protein [Bradyrhizobium sp. KBS0725]QDW42544.1 polysaccharide deacetylase family protein [Bradyrhizobium sp. KBS0727]
MRNAFGLMLASVVAAVAIAGVWFWTSSPRADAAPPQTVAARKAEPLPAAAKAKDDVEVTAALSKPAPAPAPVPQPAKSTCANPDALGVSRTVVIDTTGGPGFGFLQYKQFDFLADKEVVLTFDDGPWPTTPAVLRALADECTKAVFFPIGLHSTYHPDILKQVAAAGHTIGAHTWSHADLHSKKLNEQQGKDEIEKGFSAIKMAIGTNPSPFFRFPGLAHTQATLDYLGTRNIAMFSVDIDSLDFKSSSSDQVLLTVMTKLDKQGKGIILMHDLQKHTAQALPTLLRRLKAGGYKVVEMKAKEKLETLPEYDALLVKDLKVPAVSARPLSSVVQTVSQ